MEKAELHKIWNSFLFPFLFVSILWMVKIIELEEGLELARYGLYPREIFGLRGIFLSPFIHGDFMHLFNNSIPLLILGTTTFYFYRDVAYWVFFLTIMFTGIWVWLLARPAYHIGASGIIYGLGTFLFVSGIIRKHRGLMAISLMVAFLYGSMVWGVLPIIEENSWESHLMGALTGIILAFWFRKYGPQKQVPEWLDEEEEDEDDDEKEQEARFQWKYAYKKESDDKY